MSLPVADLHTVLQDLFGDTADDYARQTDFCRRQRRLTGSVFAQTVVFQLLHKPDATLEDYADFASDYLDLDVTPKAFDERFTSAAADFLRALFFAAFDRSLDHVRPALLPVVRRFNGVYLRDGTVITLPARLATDFPGRPGPDGQPTAAVKLVLEVNVTTGVFTDVSVLPARDNDKRAEVSHKPLPAGALLLEDLGFFAGDRLQAYDAQGVYVLTRVPVGTAFFTVAGERLDLDQWLRHAKGSHLERPVRILHHQKIPVRLLAVRVPEAVARERREQVRREAQKRGRPVSQRKLERCDWQLLVTNAPAALLSVYEAGPIRRVRWQIELVFKVFKSEGGVERTWGRTRARVEAELFGKLLAMVVQQWCLLAAGYVLLRHSARRLSRRVRARAGRLVQALGRLPELTQEIQRLAEKLRRCQIDNRPDRPSTLFSCKRLATTHRWPRYFRLSW